MLVLRKRTRDGRPQQASAATAARAAARTYHSGTEDSTVKLHFLFDLHVLQWGVLNSNRFSERLFLGEKKNLHRNCLVFCNKCTTELN